MCSNLQCCNNITFSFKRRWPGVGHNPSLIFCEVTPFSVYSITYSFSFMKRSPRLILSWMFNHNPISSSLIGFYLYFNRKLCSYWHEPIMNGNYHGVCYLFSEFTTYYKWDPLLEILTDSLFCSYYFSSPFHHSTVFWGWKVLCTLKHTICTSLFVVWSTIKLDFLGQVANPWFKPAMQLVWGTNSLYPNYFYFCNYVFPAFWSAFWGTTTR